MCSKVNGRASRLLRDAAGFFGIVILFLCAFCANLGSSYPEVGSASALFLTPFLEAGDIATAREASKVGFIVDGLPESHAGYLTVNKAYDSNVFFWLFRAKVSMHGGFLKRLIQYGTQETY
jgi:hypothetical protein